VRQRLEEVVYCKLTRVEIFRISVAMSQQWGQSFRKIDRLGVAALNAPLLIEYQHPMQMPLASRVLLPLGNVLFVPKMGISGALRQSRIRC